MLSDDLFSAMDFYLKKSKTKQNIKIQGIFSMNLSSNYISIWIYLYMCLLWLLISRANDVYLLAGLKQELIQLVQ